MRHALEWLRRLDGTRVGHENSEEAAQRATERAFAATVTEASLDSKLLLTLLAREEKGEYYLYVFQTLRWKSLVFDF
jgi:hypothetical protein